MRHAPAPGILLALALLTAVASCTYSKQEEVLTSVTGPIEARVVRVERKLIGITAIGGGHVGIVVPAKLRETDCELRISKPKSLTFAIEGACSEQRIASDPSGMRLAWGSKSSYRYIYFGTNGRSFDGPKTLAEPIVWDSVPTLEQAFPSIFRKTLELEDSNLRFVLSGGKLPPATFGEALVDQIIEMRGAAGMAKVLVETQDAPFRLTWRGYVALWHRAFLRLEEPARQTVRTALIATLNRAEASPNALAHAMSELDLGTPEHDAALLARTRKLAAEPVNPTDPTTRNLLAAAFRQLWRRKPKETAELACSYLSRWEFVAVLDARISDDAGAALLALAAIDSLLGMKKACPAVNKLFSIALEEKGFGLCTEGIWFCPDSEDRKAVRARCTAAEYRQRLESLVNVPWPKLVERLEEIEHIYVPGLAFARMSAGKLPPDFDRSLARQAYAWSLVDKPPCSIAAPGQKCAGDWDQVTHMDVCDTASKVTLGLGKAGQLRFDDVKRIRWFEGAASDAGTP